MARTGGNLSLLSCVEFGNFTNGSARLFCVDFFVPPSLDFFVAPFAEFICESTDEEFEDDDEDEQGREESCPKTACPTSLNGNSIIFAVFHLEPAAAAASVQCKW